MVDFGQIKKITRKICKELNETFLVPMKSDVLSISVSDAQIELKTECNKLFMYVLFSV